MQPIRRTEKRGLRTAIAATLAVVLFLAGMAVCVPGIHRLLHAGGHGDDSGCVVCQMAQGHCTTSAAFRLASPESRSVTAMVVPVRTAWAQGLMFAVALGRGPPVRFPAR